MDKHRCIINVKALAEGNVENGKVHLDDAFFESFNSSEIFGGDVDVVVESEKLSGESYSVCLNIVGSVKVPCTRCLDSMDFAVDLADEMEVCLGRQLTEEERGEGLPEATIIGDCDVAERLFETILLNLPTTHCHSEGTCNSEMIEKLHEHSSDERINEITN